MNDETLSKFGVTSEEIEKSQDINPTFNLGKFEVGTSIMMTILDKEPKEVEHKNKFKTKVGEPDKIKTPVLNISVMEIRRPQKDQENLIIPMHDEKYSLFLSSKSLSLGLAKVAVKNNNSLKDVSVIIKISETEYKEFGINRCYNVSETS